MTKNRKNVFQTLAEGVSNAIVAVACLPLIIIDSLLSE